MLFWVLIGNQWDLAPFFLIYNLVFLPPKIYRILWFLSFTGVGLGILTDYWRSRSLRSILRVRIIVYRLLSYVILKIYLISLDVSYFIITIVLSDSFLWQVLFIHFSQHSLLLISLSATRLSQISVWQSRKTIASFWDISFKLVFINKWAILLLLHQIW